MLADLSGWNCIGSASALRQGCPRDELILSSHSVADLLSANPLQALLYRHFHAFTLYSLCFSSAGLLAQNCFADLSFLACYLYYTLNQLSGRNSLISSVGGS